MNNTPIVWMYKKESTGEVFFENSGDIDHGWIPLYTSQPKRYPLSEDEITKLWRDNTGYLVSHNQFARAIEKAHGIGE